MLPVFTQVSEQFPGLNSVAGSANRLKILVFIANSCVEAGARALERANVFLEKICSRHSPPDTGLLVPLLDGSNIHVEYRKNVRGTTESVAGVISAPKARARRDL